MTDIEWCVNPDGTKGKTWNPTRGCSRCSPGCDNCYAKDFAHRFSNEVNGKPGPYKGLTIYRPETANRPGVDWSGKVVPVPEMLGVPRRWRKPQRCFVDSMSDLFHESLGWERDIDPVFEVMESLPRHTFLILTKRARNMRDYVADRYRRTMAKVAPNIWLGVSAENQELADERVPLLLETPAAIRFVSAEPLLGPLDLSRWLGSPTTLHVSLSVSGALKNGGNSLDGLCGSDGRPLSRAAAKAELERLLASGVKSIPATQCDNFDDQKGCRGHRKPGIDWLIVGGEAGRGARPFDVCWAESLVEQCRERKAACFVKQLGRHPFDSRESDRATDEPHPDGPSADPSCRLNLDHRKGADMSEWSEHLQVRQWPMTEVSDG